MTAAAGSPAPLLVSPDPPPAELVALLAGAGEAWVAVGSAEDPERSEPEGGWSGALVSAGDPDAAFALCRALRKRDPAVVPVVLIVPAERLAALELREDLFDDFVVVGGGGLAAAGAELLARLAHQRWRAGRSGRPELVEYGELVLNLETYQAAVGGRPLDLTYMEYELLKFLATHPGKVFTREALLSQVWGYEYFGGARTVDVHVRRLRAKLGEEHAGLISTVRSVGYRFGQGRWTA